MIRLTTLSMALLLMYTAMAQSKDEKYYVFDKDWKGTDLKTGVYFMRTRKLGEKEFLWTTYQMYGPRISQEVFQDEAGNIRNGYCRYYHTNGCPDSMGAYVNGLPNGDWWYYNNEGVAYRRKDFQKGVFIKDSLFNPVPADSAHKTDISTGEVESAFKGGAKEWLKFMTNNFEYPARAQNFNVQGTVFLEFIVDENGRVQSPEISKSAEFSLDEEALRLIRVSPAWIPATKDGKAVKSYKRQPVIFRLTAN